MYSEALAILDYNTTQYMIDELTTQNESLTTEIATLKEEIENLKAQIASMQK